MRTVNISEIAKLVPMDSDKEGLPSLEAMRSSIECKGSALSQDIVDTRKQERF